MNTETPLWLSIARNAYGANNGTPVISQGTSQWFVRVTDHAQLLLESDTSLLRL
jgi:hypothetical protein